uniref:Ig-like domain-containing protein n=1 Tax=Malurus cyaneus samueli TaxID=2593467 RepID=A0A8C5UBT1_9PASS
FWGSSSWLPSLSPHLILPGVRGQTLEAKRREGGILHIQCPYHAPVDTVHTKYWCRKVDGKCQELVETYYKKQSKDTKITIEDNYTSKTVSITMTDLKAEDSGTYFCAYYSGKYVPLRTVSLMVSKGEYLHPHPKPSLLRKQCHSFPCSARLFLTSDCPRAWSGALTTFGVSQSCSSGSWTPCPCSAHAAPQGPA